MFGPVLSVHDGHGYTTWDRFMPTFHVLPTGDTLRGRTSVGVYFCVDWCGPCKAFTPNLKNYYTAQRASRARNNEGTLEIVLVSRCRTARESETLFSTMPWTAMPHLDSVGKRGKDLMANFGVTTIPALVFLDGTGAITHQDGRSEVLQQQAAPNRSASTATPAPKPQVGAMIASGGRPLASPAPGADSRKERLSKPNVGGNRDGGNRPMIFGVPNSEITQKPRGR